MSKAYDRVEWSFLENVLKKVGFSYVWVNKIMDCVCTNRYRVKCNTTLSEVIIPETDLRQRDPVSPYLFLFCIDALSRMLISTQETHIIKGIRVSKNGPRINHLFFADDALLFVRNKQSEMMVFTKILESFEQMSGQRINLDKSMVYFSLNIPSPQREILSRLLKMKVVSNLDAYLSLPIPIGLPGASFGLKRWEVQENKVSDLLNNEKDGWNESRIFEIYSEYLGDGICKIPLFHSSPDDYHIWFHNPLGFYSTKSAYSWLTLKHVGFGPHWIFLRLMWKLQALPKIRIFCWCLGHDILPTYEKIFSIRREVDGTCPRCGIDKETLLHAMKNCPRAPAVLVYDGLNNKVLEGTYSLCIDWIEDVARTLDKKAFSDFITVLWNIWNSRNNKVSVMRRKRPW
ncbi:hypothetical protein PVK06_027184 [Gossypium arboreum]|uniref:Reverse transcriptase domain-containing protein n=1 Tax=Gossypium arboreum TaxID=29729 RepID=A0ABR0P347_GOSAR|nr:hypothetical protein PVK06_027184 [Gossypium arboreum]